MECYLLKVAVDNTTFRFSDVFFYKSYIFVEDFKRVVVPFGRGNTIKKGLVLSCVKVNENEYLIDNNKKIYIDKIKFIENVIDSEPITKEIWDLVQFVSEKTLSTFYDVIKLVIPKGLDGNVTVKYFVINKDLGVSLKEKHKEVLSEIEDKKGVLKSSYLKENKKYIDKLLELNIIEKDYIIKEKMNVNNILVYKLSDEFNCFKDNIKLTLKQQSVVDLISDKNKMTYKEIYYFLQVSKVVVDNLVKKNVLKKVSEKVEYSNNLGSDSFEKTAYTLNSQQQVVYNKIVSSIDNKVNDSFLLFGVTGSGKTVIYIKIIEYLLSKGKSSILLVPEISLTPQITAIFKNYFDDNVSLLHSNISAGERVKEYEKIKSQKVSIVIGTRSALFAPVNNLGAIIIDEEQDNSYFSETTPRYSSKDVADFRCKYNNAILLLGSATPSVNSFYKAKNKSLKLLELKNRFSLKNLPETVIVNMKDEIKNGNVSNVSRELLRRIKCAVDAGDQAIILINRRGYETNMVCKDCFEIIKCKNCTVPIVYHKENDRFMCHHCGYIDEFLSCSFCGCHSFISNGFGTQKIEKEISNYIENAKILRMDLDTTNSKFSYKEYFDDFKNKKYNVLIGTQMISKGLDFKDVVVVGILNIDSIVAQNGYKGHEKMFSIITQAIGRCGRHNKKGTAVIQTVDASSDILNISSKQDYEEFFNEEIKVRKSLLYPPFCNICTISFKGLKKEMVFNSACSFVTIFKKHFMENDKKTPIRLLGPLEYNIFIVNNNFRYKIVIKCINNKGFRDKLRQVFDEFNKTQSKNVNVWVDFNNNTEV